MTRIRVNAVFEGGGAKAIGLAGGVAAAEAYGIRFNRVAGTSAGAIVAALLAAGYTGKQLHDLVFELGAETLVDPTPLGRIPLIGEPLSLIFLDGLYQGDALEAWVAEKLGAKGVATFGDLGRGLPLRVIASDLTRARMLILPDAAREFGEEPARLSIARAVRMSSSIPFFYRPVCWKPAAGPPSYVVDGGLSSNFPVSLFSGSGSARPVLGFRLKEADARDVRRIDGPFSLLMAIFETMMEAHDRRAIEHDLSLEVIDIPTGEVGTTDFDMTPAQKEALYERGRQATDAFLQKWIPGGRQLKRA
ncbi:MAG TPA: patatin-like phospholipase family protein [Limnochordia bacterium]|nr:patatin-like phospholipase family protein [Limnochordia bacterium]